MLAGNKIGKVGVLPQSGLMYNQHKLTKERVTPLNQAESHTAVRELDVTNRLPRRSQSAELPQESNLFP